jgi:hypothetical protein
MLASAFRKVALNSKTFALYQPRCNIPKCTFMGSSFRRSADPMDPMGGIMQSKLLKIATDPDIMVRITKAYIIVLYILHDICICMYINIYMCVNI